MNRSSTQPEFSLGGILSILILRIRDYPMFVCDRLFVLIISRFTTQFLCLIMRYIPNIPKSTSHFWQVNSSYDDHMSMFYHFLSSFYGSIPTSWRRPPRRPNPGAFQRRDGRRHTDAAGEEDDVLRQLLLPPVFAAGLQQGREFAWREGWSNGLRGDFMGNSPMLLGLRGKPMVIATIVITRNRGFPSPGQLCLHGMVWGIFFCRTKTMFNGKIQGFLQIFIWTNPLNDG